MGPYFVFILKSTCCLILFYLFYRLLLSRDTFHRFNRFALLGVIVLSVAIPFIRVMTDEPVVIQRAVSDLETLLQLGQFQDNTEIESSFIPFSLKILFLIYIGGCLFFFSHFLYSIFRIIYLIRAGKQVEQVGGIKLIVTSRAISPFSWMRYMIISRIDKEESGDEIFIHEQAHIQAGHSWDMLLAGIFVIMHWFNPAAWLLKQELQNIHEYEADECVLKQGVDAKCYQLLLIKKAVGFQRFTSMANSFNHSKIKKRITMMLKEKSNPWARLKFLYVVPLSLLTIMAFARPEISRELEKISNVEIGKVLVRMPVSETQERLASLKDKPFLLKNAREIKDMKTEQKNKEVAANQRRKNIEVISGNSDLKVDEKTTMARLALIREPLATVPSFPLKGRIGSDLKTLTIHSKQVLPGDKLYTSDTKEPLLIIDGKEHSLPYMKKLDPERIESITVLKNTSAESRYGEKGKNGVILIVLKNDTEKN